MITAPAAPLTTRRDRAETAEQTWLPLSSSRELKFIVTAKRAGRIAQWLEAVCRPDPDHPRAIVESLYFDTPRLHCVDEKLNSDYLKSKFRLRWYRLPDEPPQEDGPVFAEAKLRTGCYRHKLRAESPFPTPWLFETPLEDSGLLGFERLIRSHGIAVRHTLVPSFTVAYDRRRYVDHASGARLCVDTMIRVPRVNRMLLPRAPLPCLETAVVEVKGQHQVLPAHLHTLTDLGCRVASWSKYAACYQKLAGHNF